MSTDALGLPGYADAVPVASGGTSTVWRARETAFERLVAVKVLAFPLLDDDVRRRFSRELAMAGRLSGHPGVLTVHASGYTADGRPYLTSEWCPAGSLADVVAQSGPLPEAQVATVGVAVAEALHAAHELGVVHRDVKPQNVFVTAYGRAALGDFGIAVATAEVTSPTDSLTPTHAAPEVLQGGTAGPAADVWGLGSTLWTLLTGTPPFAAGQGEGLLPAMLRVLHSPLPEAADTPVVEVLRQLLAKDPAERPTARQVADRLRPLAAGAAALPQGSTPGAAAGEPTRRRSAAPPVVSPAAAAAGAAGVFSVLPPSSPSADQTVSRLGRPALSDDQPARRDRRPLLAALGVAAAVALVGTGWLLADRGVPAAAVAGPAGSAPSASGASGAPGAASSEPSPESLAVAEPSAAVDPPPAAVAPGQATQPDSAPAPVAQQPAPAPPGESPRPSPRPSPPRAASPEPAPQPNRIPVYRCDRGSEDLLYSTNPGCKAGYTQVRQAWSVTKDTGVPATTGLWRLRNPATGVHLLTWSADERNGLLAGGWDADGQVGWVRTSAAPGWTRIWRLHDGRRYAYTNDASLQIWKDRGFRVDGQFWS